MKKALLLGLLLVVMITIDAAAQRLQVNQYGRVRVVIDLTEYWQDFNQAQDTAYKYPGRKVLINLLEKISIRTDFFHYKMKEKYNGYIIYQDGRFITFNKPITIDCQETLTDYVIFLLIALALMIASNLAVKKGGKYLNFAVILIFFILGLNVGAFVTAYAIGSASAAMVFIIINIIIAFIFTSDLLGNKSYHKNSKVYKTLCVIFYICAVLALMIGFVI